MRMNLYGIVFRASREIGQAMVLSGLTEKDGSANCRSAAGLLRLILPGDAEEVGRIKIPKPGMLELLFDPGWRVLVRVAHLL